MIVATTSYKCSYNYKLYRPFSLCSTQRLILYVVYMKVDNMYKLCSLYQVQSMFPHELNWANSA